MELKPYIQGKKTIHLVGIGGVSMCALGELLLSQGVPVTGSDRMASPITARLEQLGAQIFLGHAAENVTNAALVIRTAAVHDDNPEIQQARQLQIPVMERAEAWGSLMTDYQEVICLAGTHGKTTTTSMMTLAAMQTGLNPTVMVGSHLPAIGGTLRIGGHGCFVAESCEYCNSFLSFAPTVAVVLNIEADHLDFFRDLDDIVNSFHRFCEKVPEYGAVVVNADDENALRAVQGIKRKVISFGTHVNANVQPVNIAVKNGYFSFDVLIDGSYYAHVALNVPGYHNMMNALACCAAAWHLQLAGKQVAKGLEAFNGVSRRFEKTGQMPCGAVVVDDYAHHPSEMRATLRTARQMGFRRILCAFQPHTYTRTKALFDEFVEALKLCDQAILAPIYAAREKNTIGIQAADLAAQVPDAVAFSSLEEIAAYLKEQARAGDLVLTMGAGDIFQVGKMLVE